MGKLVGFGVGTGAGYGVVGSTEILRKFAGDAEENGREIEIGWDEEWDLIRWVEVDGVEYWNSGYEEEREEALELSVIRRFGS